MVRNRRATPQRVASQTSLNSFVALFRFAAGVKCMIQRDALFQDYNVEVPLKNLSQEILRRSAVLSPKPIYVTLSAPNALNITFIDTPGLPPPPSAGDVPQDIRVPPHFNGRATASDWLLMLLFWP
jgi:hypothetical protein